VDIACSPVACLALALCSRGEKRIMDIIKAKRLLPRKLGSWLYRKARKSHPGISPFVMSKIQAESITPPSDLSKLFYSHSGRVIHKWVHYLPLYDLYFKRFKDSHFKMLEIGVSEGGSLELWRRYFGEQAAIYGVDINPECASRVDPPNQIRIGSQDDPEFLASVVAEMGGVDLILDDGSHLGSHIITSFRTLFPLLSDGGLYAIEDMHDDFAEWPGTRYNQSLSFVKKLIDDMHTHFHGLPPRETSDIGGIHVFDSIVFIEKKAGHRTGHVVVS
jgi:hypothetical protein